MFDHEVTVEKNGFHVGQQRVVAVEIRPARLHHADFSAAIGVHEIRNRAAKKITFGDEIGVKYGYEFTLCGFQAVFECASFVAFAVGAMNVDDGHALSGVAFDAGVRHLPGLVGGIVEDLHIEEFRRVVKTRNGLDEAFDHVALVENGKLDGHARPVGDWWRSSGDVLGIHEVVVHQPIPVQAVKRQNHEDDKVGNHHRQVEGIGVVHACKSLIAQPAK